MTAKKEFFKNGFMKLNSLAGQSLKLLSNNFLHTWVKAVS